MDAEVNIGIEYERLFGAANTINLFDSDEEYENLRQYIIGQPNDHAQINALPFDGITVTPYNEYVWNLRDRGSVPFCLFSAML